MGVSRQGEFKNTIKIFLQKVHVENFFQNFDKNFRCQFFLDFFCFIAFSGVSQRWEFKNTTKNVLQKKSCRKVFTKNSTKNPKPTFSRFFFYHVFGRFSMRGVQKHDKKNIEKINLTLVLFRTLTHLPTTGVTDFFFFGGPGPLKAAHYAVFPAQPQPNYLGEVLGAVAAQEKGIGDSC